MNELFLFFALGFSCGMIVSAVIVYYSIKPPNAAVRGLAPLDGVVSFSEDQCSKE